MGIGTGMPCSDCGISSPLSSSSFYYPPATINLNCVSTPVPSFNANTGRHSIWKQYVVASMSGIKTPAGVSIGWTDTELLLPGSWDGSGITLYKNAGGKFVFVKTFPGTLLGSYSGVSTYTFYVEEILAVIGSYIYHRRWERSPNKQFKAPDDNTRMWGFSFGSPVPGDCEYAPGFTYKESPILCPVADIPGTYTVTCTLGEKNVFHDDGGVCCPGGPSGGDGGTGQIYDGTRTINVTTINNVDGWCVGVTASGPSCVGGGSPGIVYCPYQNFDVDYNAWKPQSLGGYGSNSFKIPLRVEGGLPCPWVYPSCTSSGVLIPTPTPFTVVMWGDAVNNPSGVSVSGAVVTAMASLTGGGYVAGPPGLPNCKKAKRWDGVDGTDYYYAPGTQKQGGGAGSNEWAVQISSSHTQSDITVTVP